MTEILHFMLTAIIVILLTTVTMISIMATVFVWKEIKRLNDETT